MESKCVDRPYVVFFVYSLAMTFESIFFLLDFWAGIEILDGDAPLHGARCITLSIGHACQGARQELQTAIAFSDGRIEVSDVVDVEEAGGHGDDKFVACDVHVVYTLGEVFGCLCLRGVVGARVPEPEGSVP